MPNLDFFSAFAAAFLGAGRYGYMAVAHVSNARYRGGEEVDSAHIYESPAFIRCEQFMPELFIAAVDLLSLMSERHGRMLCQLPVRMGWMALWHRISN